MTKSAIRELAEPDCRRCDVQHDRPVGYHRQPVCMCIVYDRRGDPCPGEKTKEATPRRSSIRTPMPRVVGTWQPQVQHHCRVQCWRHCAARRRCRHHGPWRHPWSTTPGTSLQRDPQVPRRERRTVHGELQPRTGDPHVLFG